MPSTSLAAPMRRTEDSKRVAGGALRADVSHGHKKAKRSSDAGPLWEPDATDGDSDEWSD